MVLKPISFSINFFDPVLADCKHFGVLLKNH